MVGLKYFTGSSLNAADFLVRKRPSISFITEMEDGGLKILARFKRTVDLITHIRRHRRVKKALSHPAIRDGLHGEQHIAVKYLHPRYLARGLATDDKAKIVLHHYEIIRKYFSPEALGALADREILLWKHDEPQAVHAVAMRYAHPADNEGELILEYRFNDSVIYTASFAFAPGVIIGSHNHTAMFLTRLQGAKDSFQNISLAMKSLRGLSGSVVLLAALLGIAESLEIKIMLGPTAEAQACYSRDLHASFVSMYDDFFGRLNGNRISESLYSIALPITEKPLSEVKATNRPKVRAQRNYKRLISDACRAALNDSRPIREASGPAVHSVAA